MFLCRLTRIACSGFLRPAREGYDHTEVTDTLDDLRGVTGNPASSQTPELQDDGPSQMYLRVL
jgi:hypothetical protein